MISSNRKIRPEAANPSYRRVILVVLILAFGSLRCHAWTLWDLNPWKQLRERRIFSLTRADPIGVRVMIVPVIDDPINAPVYTRLAGEFANSLRSFANEVWLITDLPNNPVKAGFYTALPRILADYRMRNYLSMDLLRQMIPDFECDFIALFEVTAYDRYWVDEDLQHRVGVRAVFYDYEDGEPRLEKYAEGGRGRRLEEGAFSEAERIAVKNLVEELERPLRMSVAAREAELKRRYDEMTALAALTSGREAAIHKYDLALMQQRIAEVEGKALEAEQKARQKEQELQEWKQKAAYSQSLLQQIQQQPAGRSTTSAPRLLPAPTHTIRARVVPSRRNPPPDLELRIIPPRLPSPVEKDSAVHSERPQEGFDLTLDEPESLSGEWEYVGTEDETTPPLVSENTEKGHPVIRVE